MSRIGTIGHKLYTGELSVDFIQRRRVWYAISAVVLLVAIGALVFRGLNFSIEFRGGVDFQAPTHTSAPAAQIPTVRSAVTDSGVPGVSEPTVTTVGRNQLQVETPALSIDDIATVRKAIGKSLGVSESEVAYSSIGPTWGSQITSKALTSLGVFLALVMLVIWLYFREWRMSVSGLVALLHDVAITIGIYALVGFDVTPATVIGVLTILGYSLYDTVVVFDKVRENTAGISVSSRWTFSEAANLAVNQTLVRSINTSVIALLPVAGILFVGAGLLGAGTLKDLALALFIGIAVGTYSSIFIATPLLCELKEREPAMKALARRVEQRRRSSEPVPAVAAASESNGDAAPVAIEAASAAAPARSGQQRQRSAGAPGARGRSQPQRRPRSSRKSKGRRR